MTAAEPRLGSSPWPRYKVQFRTEPALPAEARAHYRRLESSSPAARRGNHATGWRTAEVDTHVAWVDANGEDAAGRALTEALEGKPSPSSYSASSPWSDSAGFVSAGGGTRTLDTRMMIGWTQGSEGSGGASQARRGSHGCRDWRSR